MRVVTIVGARPQFIKAAPVSCTLRLVADEYVVHTGQHYDAGMSGVFFADLDMPEPNVDLGVGSGSHGAQTGRMLEAIETVLADQRPDWVLVYGDTNSTLAGSLAAAKLHIPVAHVEAGLRSFRRDMPEEINRVLTDHMASMLFAPTQSAVRNLKAEGITKAVHLVGDVMADSIEAARPRLDPRRLENLGIEVPFYAATLHRAETVDSAVRLGAAVSLLAEVHEPVVIPVHPRTAAAVARFDIAWPDNVRPIPPLGYVDMLTLVAHADAVLTDSGGLQKESVLLGVPCITMRPETEWVETVEAGLNAVVDLDGSSALAALGSIRGDVQAARRLFPVGAAQAISDLLCGS